MSDEEGDVLSVMLQGNGVLDKSKDTGTINVLRKYEDEWEQLCYLAQSGLPDLQRHAVLMHLQGSRLRSLYWQLLLGSLPTSPSLWISILRQQRNSYRLLHQRLSVDPHQANSDDNPLSQSTASVWHQYFCDKELRALIRQDVVRTFPSMDFFRTESIQATMVNILFCYAREHPEICYRQGMHEVLAPLLFVMQEDQKSLLRARELASVSDRAAEILDPAWLEEDAYWLFCKLMSHLAGNYRVKNMIPLVTGHFPTSIKKYNNNLCLNVAETELASRLTYIRDKLLRQFDKELYVHLKGLDIPFQTFGIRWLRLLFGQEFALTDLLYVWDTVFAEGDDLVNYIFVSMLSAIRDQLIIEDDTECLMLLMRYPSGVDVRSVVENALLMWKPKKFASLKENGGRKEATESNIALTKIIPAQSTISGRFKKLNLWSQKRNSSLSQSHMPSSSVTTHEKSIPRYDKNDGAQNVIEGYTLHDPMVAKAELQHLHNLLTLVHSHLERYHSTLEHTLPSNTPHAGKAALDGIKQLCKHLGSSLPTVPRSIEVEAAFEAQPVLKTGTTGSRSIPSESITQKIAQEELKVLEVFEGLEYPEFFPLDNPLRALSFHPSGGEIHISYCRELGASTN